MRCVYLLRFTVPNYTLAMVPALALTLALVLVLALASNLRTDMPRAYSCWPGGSARAEGGVRLCGRRHKRVTAAVPLPG